MCASYQHTRLNRCKPSKLFHEAIQQREKLAAGLFERFPCRVLDFVSQWLKVLLMKAQIEERKASSLSASP